jgi:Adenine-specific methyltransferase EcoRI
MASKKKTMPAKSTHEKKVSVKKSHETVSAKKSAKKKNVKDLPKNGQSSAKKTVAKTGPSKKAPSKKIAIDDVSQAGNSNNLLRKASKAKKDEFYTQLSDIEKEMKNYKSYFKGKVIYCNCDDPYESNFFKYFSANFNSLGLKKLIVGGQLSLFDLEGLKPNGREPFKIEITEVPDLDGDGAIGLYDVEILLKSNKNSVTPLVGDGDFRSRECTELLKEADIVVTNPPFSLFREYISQLETYKKSYIIIGNTNAITYREIFKLIRDNKLRTGYTNFNVGMFFEVPEDWEKFHHIDEKGRKIARVSTSCWFTNLEVTKHKDYITLYKKYSKSEYPTYTNFEAIEVSKVSDIPMDFAGTMGVPITFVDKYNPEQFEIIDINPHFFTLTEKGLEKPTQLKIQGQKDPYARILIKNKKVVKK